MHNLFAKFVKSLNICKQVSGNLVNESGNISGCTIRYFQPDGRGRLKIDNGTVFKPNNRYPLHKEEFRLYYTSASTDQQTIDVYVEDNI